MKEVLMLTPKTIVENVAFCLAFLSNLQRLILLFTRPTNMIVLFHIRYLLKNKIKYYQVILSF